MCQGLFSWREAAVFCCQKKKDEVEDSLYWLWSCVCLDDKKNHLVWQQNMIIFSVRLSTKKLRLPGVWNGRSEWEHLTKLWLTSWKVPREILHWESVWNFAVLKREVVTSFCSHFIGKQVILAYFCFPLAGSGEEKNYSADSSSDGDDEVAAIVVGWTSLWSLCWQRFGDSTFGLRCFSSAQQNTWVTLLWSTFWLKSLSLQTVQLAPCQQNAISL